MQIIIHIYISNVWYGHTVWKHLTGTRVWSRNPRRPPPNTWWSYWGHFRRTLSPPEFLLVLLIPASYMKPCKNVSREKWGKIKLTFLLNRIETNLDLPQQLISIHLWHAIICYDHINTRFLLQKEITFSIRNANKQKKSKGILERLCDQICNLPSLEFPMLFPRYRQPSLQHTQTQKLFSLNSNKWMTELARWIDSSYLMTNKSHLCILICGESAQLLHDRPSCHRLQEHASHYRQNPFNYLLSKSCLQMLSRKIKGRSYRERERERKMMQRKYDIGWRLYLQWLYI